MVNQGQSPIIVLEIGDCPAFPEIGDCPAFLSRVSGRYSRSDLNTILFSIRVQVVFTKYRYAFWLHETASLGEAGKWRRGAGRTSAGLSRAKAKTASCPELVEVGLPCASRTDPVWGFRLGSTEPRRSPPRIAFAFAFKAARFASEFTEVSGHQVLWQRGCGKRGETRDGVRSNCFCRSDSRQMPAALGLATV